MVQVRVQEGVLEGVEVDNYLGGKFYSFKGIPYAQPPIGDLRFKAPQPPKPWTGVRSAKEHGPQCYHYDTLTRTVVTSGSEDCLYLNVYTPNVKPNKPLPVMFWIHGGAFILGSGNDDFYGPEFLVRNDVILVTINYRLEVVGFLSLQTEDIPGNAGMKDQVAALRWVKKNISNFGGNPDNITIFGESAGGASVSYLLISPMTKGLFKRAIVQSGWTTNSWSTVSEPREIAKALARKLGLDSDDDKELYEFFKAQPIEKLIQAKVPITLSEEANALTNLQYCIVDEKQLGNNERFFYGDPWDVMRSKGIHEGVEVMSGFCKHEGPIFLGFMDNIEKYIEHLNSYPEMFAPKEIILNCSQKDILEVGRKVKKYYLGNKKVGPETLEAVFSYLSAEKFVYGGIQWQKMASLKNKVYCYKFTCFSERNKMGEMMKLNDLIQDKPVVVHGEDFAYLFPVKVMTQEVKKDSETFKMIENVTKLWTNFAKSGNPTPDKSLGVTWSPYTAEEQAYLEIGNQLKTSTKPCDEEIKFWEGIFRQYLPKCVA